jgi:hypothetical protein
VLSNVEVGPAGQDTTFESRFMKSLIILAVSGLSPIFGQGSCAAGVVASSRRRSSSPNFWVVRTLAS